MLRKVFCCLLILFALVGLAAAQEPLAPPEVTGEVVYIPFPVEIAVDGNLDDWANVPTVIVDRGTSLSADPAENGSFTFAVAADAQNFYITMTMPDKNIITGQHQTNFWNEDSLEFYLNLSGDLGLTSYKDTVFQINLNPSDIGNTDPAKVTVTGTNSAKSKTQAVVFKTDDGWGFEAAVPLPEGLTPAHGLEIGFQAHANGATTKDRDVKLIWSLGDTADISYQDPSVFGTGIFFEVGQTEIPTPSPRTAEAVAVEATPAPPARAVSINQVGYFPDAPKLGILAGNGPQRVFWTLKEAESGTMVASGTTTAGKLDEASGDYVQVVDFSDVTTPGTYVLEIDGIASAPFKIGNDVYSQLKVDALRYFYLNRSGIELEEAYAGDWARPAGHLSDNEVTCFKGTDAEGTTWDGCDYTLKAGGGWYDAGDYGKYVVNGGISVWTLLNLYERLPEALGDSTLNIPESGNKVSDLLDEARWEMEWLLSMQVPEGQPQAGMAHHKLHDDQWAGMPVLPATTVDSSARHLMPPSTAATLNLAATAAQCARIWETLDADFAARCLTAAETAWTAANENPVFVYGNIPGNGGGNYGDGNVDDEFYWAAAELYITTGQDVYLDFLKASPYFKKFGTLTADSTSAMYWGNTAALGSISLALVPNDLPEAEVAALREQIVKTADAYLERMAAEGYGVSFGADRYVWGSNSDVLNNAIVLALAYDFTQDVRYLDGAASSMDYILGRNALHHSFVSGYGANAMQHPHHRFWGNQPDNGFPPPPPGAIAGGPNGEPSDPDALDAVTDQPPAKRYIDVIGSYSTNEVAINWNAPLTWVTTYLDATFAGGK